MWFAKYIKGGAIGSTIIGKKLKIVSWIYFSFGGNLTPLYHLPGIVGDSNTFYEQEESGIILSFNFMTSRQTYRLYLSSHLYFFSNFIKSLLFFAINSHSRG